MDVVVIAMVTNDEWADSSGSLIAFGGARRWGEHKMAVIRKLKIVGIHSFSFVRPLAILVCTRLKATPIWFFIFHNIPTCNHCTSQLYVIIIN